MKFNLNAKVTFRLTADGKALLSDTRPDISNFTPEEIEEFIRTGVVTTQLWTFMAEFGPECFMGGPLLVEGNTVEIENVQ